MSRRCETKYQNKTINWSKNEILCQNRGAAVPTCESPLIVNQRKKTYGFYMRVWLKFFNSCRLFVGKRFCIIREKHFCETFSIGVRQSLYLGIGRMQVIIRKTRNYTNLWHRMVRKKLAQRLLKSVLVCQLLHSWWMCSAVDQSDYVLNRFQLITSV